jgi:dihydroorotase
MQITITQADDWHLHLRDGAALEAVVGHSARQFGRAIIMPNLKPPVTSTAQALEYRHRILNALPVGVDFNPLMTLYLTDNTSASEIHRAADTELIHAVKYYPAGATTNSDAGVTDIRNCYAALQAMAELGMPLLIHGEVTDPAIDIFDREAVFIETVLRPLLSDLPDLKIVLEHITTADAADFVREGPATLAATITVHHLLLNRNALFSGGLRPHHYCLPVLKREHHRQALIAAATSGDPKFFLGTDSAPHARNAKESDCGCAGIYTGLHALELYAGVFESVDALDKLEGFASFFGPDFYRLPRNRQTLTLERQSWQIPASLPFGDSTLVPFNAGQYCQWRLVGE